MSKKSTPDSWTSPEVARILGVDRRIPTIWAERGYISPSIEDANGRGTKRLWSYLDVVKMAALSELRGTLSPKVLRQLMGLSAMAWLARPYFYFKTGDVVISVQTRRIRGKVDALIEKANPAR